MIALCMLSFCNLHVCCHGFPSQVFWCIIVCSQISVLSNNYSRYNQLSLNTLNSLGSVFLFWFVFVIPFVCLFLFFVFCCCCFWGVLLGFVFCCCFLCFFVVCLFCFLLICCVLVLFCFLFRYLFLFSFFTLTQFWIPRAYQRKYITNLAH